MSEPQADPTPTPAEGSAPAVTPAADPPAANGAAPPDGGPAATTQADWRPEGLDDETQRWTEKWTSGKAQVTSHRELERRLGRSIVIPGKDASTEDVQKFHRQLGVPDEAAGYKIDLGDQELDDATTERIAAFQQVMHAEGARPGVVQAAVAFHQNFLAEAQRAHDAAIMAAQEATAAELKREWSGEFDRNLNIGKRFRDKVAPEGHPFRAFLDETLIGETRLGDHPEMLRMLATAGRSLLEDDSHLPLDAAEMSTAEEQITKLERERDEAGHRGDETLRQLKDAEVRKAIGRVEGPGPIVGASGRTV